MKIACKIVGVAALLLATGAALRAQGVPANTGPAAAAMPAALRNVGFEPPLNGQMPVDLAFVYYNCPMLCDQIQMGVVGTLRMLSFNPGRDYEVVFVSFDARETPEMAAAKKKTALNHFRRPETVSGWHFLTGSKESI